MTSKIGWHPKPAMLWCEVVCEECATTCCGEFFTRRAPIRALTEEAIKRGWRLRMDGTFLCNVCIKMGYKK